MGSDLRPYEVTPHGAEKEFCGQNVESWVPLLVPEEPKCGSINPIRGASQDALQSIGVLLRIVRSEHVGVPTFHTCAETLGMESVKRKRSHVRPNFPVDEAFQGTFYMPCRI